MNTQSVNCRRLPGPHFPDEMLAPGDFIWGEERDGIRCLYIVLPSNLAKHNPDAIHVKRGAPGGDRVWGWDGNEDQPTLMPSILWPGVWHGYLTKGRLVSV